MLASIALGQEARMIQASEQEGLCKFITLTIQDLTDDLQAIQKQVTPNLLWKIHGTGLALSSLLSVVPTSDLGVPATLLEKSLSLAIALIQTENLPAQIAVVVGETGWVILASLMKQGPAFVERKLEDLFSIWNSKLKASKALINQLKKEKDAEIFVTAKAEALSSVYAFLLYCPTLITERVSRQLSTLLDSMAQSALALSEKLTSDKKLLFKLNLVRSFSQINHQSSALLDVIKQDILNPKYSASFSSLLEAQDSVLNQADTNFEKFDELMNSPPPFSQDFSILWLPALHESLQSATPIQLIPLSSLILEYSSIVFGQLFVPLSDDAKPEILELLINTAKVILQVGN